MLIFAENTHFTNTLDFDTGLDSFDRKRLNSSEKSCYWQEIIHFLYEVLDPLSGHDIWKPWTGKEVSSLICHSFLLPSSLCHFISSSCLLPLLFFLSEGCMDPTIWKLTLFQWWFWNDSLTSIFQGVGLEVILPPWFQ